MNRRGRPDRTRRARDGHLLDLLTGDLVNVYDDPDFWGWIAHYDVVKGRWIVRDADPPHRHFWVPREHIVLASDS
jgi:hypothetical protein